MYLLANFCAEGSDVYPFLNLLAMVITIVKVVIPLLLIIFGMLDVGKAVVGSKEDDIKKALKQFAYRAAAAVLVFFIPSIVGLLMTAVGQTGKADGVDWRECATALGLR